MAQQARLRWSLSAALLVGTAGAAYPWPSWVKQGIFTAGYYGYGNAKLTTLVAFGNRHDGQRTGIGALPLAGLAFGDHGLVGTTSLPGSAYKLLPSAGGTAPWAAIGISHLANGTAAPLTQIGEDVVVGTEPGDAFLLTNTGGHARKAILHAFTGGDAPLSGLTVGPGGVLYGTASGGPGGNGLVYALTPSFDGSFAYNVVYAFGAALQGQIPGGGVTFGPDGRLYGTTISGGKLSCFYPQTAPVAGCGVLYRLTPPPGGHGPWTETVLHSFAGGPDGAGPGDVTLDAHGTVYGATIAGGSGNRGTIYQAHPGIGGNPAQYSVLWTFTGGIAGHNPNSKLALDAGGALYGTAQGGAHGDGTVFILVPPYLGYAWQFSLIHSFGGNDGATPVGGLILDKAGAVFGVTLYGGAYDGGTAYEILP